MTPPPATSDLSADRSLRVGIIAPPWLPIPPPAYGGTETVLDVLARALQQAGHRVLLYTTGDSTCPVPRSWSYARALGIGRGGAADEALHVVEAYEELHDVDVVHDHTLVGPLYALGMADRTVVTTNHGPFDQVLTPLYRAVADRIPLIAISHHQASTADGVHIGAVIHHGLDVERVPVGTGGGGYAAFVGRMHPDKGVDVAISVARQAGMPLKIAAKMREPAERRYFEERIEPLLGGDVEFVGEVGGAAKFALMGQATCLLNPVRWHEPFGMVMIEALACGTPVVATARGAAPEIVEPGRTGYLASDAAGLVRALGRAGSLERRACRAEVEARFSAARMAAAHVALYRSALEASEARRAGALVLAGAPAGAPGPSSWRVPGAAGRSPDGSSDAAGAWTDGYRGTGTGPHPHSPAA